jgi:radical SAM protein with 4Fe4S-binding SPASM domain
LTTNEALDVVQQLAALPAREVALIGGEAYLRSDWDVIARAITEHGMQCSMVTGGRGLDEEVARRARAAGVVNVSVSLDGLEATHDVQRGVCGSYRAALQALHHLSGVGIPASVNTQINRLSAPELPQLLEVLHAEGIWAWRVHLTVAMGRAADHAEWLLQPYELIELFPRLAELQRECVGRHIVFAPGNNIGYFGPYEQLWRGGDTGAAYWQGCQAGESTLGIEADGTVKGCPSLPTGPYAAGSLRDQSLLDLIEGPLASRIRLRAVADLWGFCSSCYYADVCRAGCTWTSHVLFGRSGNNPYCHHRVLELQKQGLRERLVQTVQAPGVPFDYGHFALIVEPLPGREVADVPSHT